MRFASTCRSRSGSPTTGAGPSVRTSIGRSGAVTRASSTASRASAARSTSSRSGARISSSRASVRRSSTSTPMRAASSSIRCIAFCWSSTSPAAPMRSSSAYPRIDASGVRSSCEASARKRRSRSSLSCRSANASSRRLSIALSDEPQPPDLRLRRRGADAVRHVAPGDRPGRAAHPLERPQPDPDDEPRADAEQQQHAADDERLDQQQTIERLRDVAQRDRDDGRPAPEAVRAAATAR